MQKKLADVKFDTSGEVLTAHIYGEIDHRGAVGIRTTIDIKAASSGAHHLVLDLSGVDFMDSSGLGLILGRYNNAKKSGIGFSVKNPSRSAERILTAAGAGRIINIIRQEESMPKKEFKNENQGTK